MNGDAMPLGGDGDINSKFNFLVENLLKNKGDEKPDITALKSLKEALFPEEKEDKARFRRFKQKQRVLQAVPISIDGLTTEGQKDLRKTFKDLFSFKVDVEKPDPKKGPWAKLFFILAFVIGFIIGAVLGFLEQVKKFFSFLKNSFKILYNIFKDTSIGKFIRGLFNSIKLKILAGIKALKETKIAKLIKGFFDSVKQTVLGWKAAFKDSTIIKTLKSVFDTAKARALSIFESVKNLFGKVKSFFKPLISFFEKFKLGKMIPTGALKVFTGFLSQLGGFFSLGLKVGRLFGKILAPLMALFEVGVGLFQAFTDPKLKDKSFLQKMVTGLVKGILNFFDIFEIFGLNLIKFDEIRDRIEKIFKPFREGKWIEGIGQIFNQIQSFAIGIPGKIFGWIIGWFNKDLGKKITEYFEKFDIAEEIKKLGSFLMDKILGFVKGVVDVISNIFNLDNIKDWIKDKLGFKSPEKEVEVKDVGDLTSTSDRTLFTGRQAYRFDQQDEILALKEGGPIEKLLQDRESMPVQSLDELNRTVRDLSNAFAKYASTTLQVQQNEQKLMMQNIDVLKAINDKENNNNVVVQNSSNNMVLQEKASSNLDFRKDLSWISRY